MEKRCRHLVLTVIVFHETVGFGIRNEQLGKCLQLQVSRSHSRLTVEECIPGSGLQEWHWDPDTLALRHLQTGDCLSVLEVQGHVSILLKRCGGKSEEREGQVWSCSKKGHLTLQGRGLHLSIQHNKIFLSKERGRGSKWKTLSNNIICKEHQWHQHNPFQLISPASSISSFPQQRYTLAQPMDDDLELTIPTNADLMEHITHSFTSLEPEDSSKAFFSLEYGMPWKVTMLVLSSLALLLGVSILLMNIHYNRKKKEVCVLESVTQNETANQQGSPVINERAPLTQHALHPPHSSSLRRGEILIEWKDGTITPLFENSCYVTY